MRVFSVFLLLAVQATAPHLLVPAGTPVEARLESSVQTATSNAGDDVQAVVTEPIRIAGRIAVPRGSRLNGRVETIEPATAASEGRVRLVFREIEFADGRRLSTWITDSFSASPPNRKLRYLLFMGLGSAAGSWIGGSTGRISGIIGGTLVGFILAGNSGNDQFPDLQLKRGRLLHLRFGEDLKL
jgi:hypothetical protein